MIKIVDKDEAKRRKEVQDAVEYALKREGLDKPQPSIKKSEEPTQPQEQPQETEPTVQPQETEQPARYQRIDTERLKQRPDNVDRFNNILGRIGRGQTEAEARGSYYADVPQPDRSGYDKQIKSNKKKAKLALQAEALRLISDIAAGVYGGNIYARQPYTLKAIREAKNKNDALEMAYQNSVANWQKGLRDALAKAGEERKDRFNIALKLMKEEGLDKRQADKLLYDADKTNVQIANEFLLEDDKQKNKEELADKQHKNRMDEIAKRGAETRANTRLGVTLRAKMPAGSMQETEVRYWRDVFGRLPKQYAENFLNGVNSYGLSKMSPDAMYYYEPTTDGRMIRKAKSKQEIDKMVYDEVEKLTADDMVRIAEQTIPDAEERARVIKAIREKEESEKIEALPSIWD